MVFSIRKTTFIYSGWSPCNSEMLASSLTNVSGKRQFKSKWLFYALLKLIKAKVDFFLPCLFRSPISVWKPYTQFCHWQEREYSTFVSFQDVFEVVYFPLLYSDDLPNGKNRHVSLLHLWLTLIDIFLSYRCIADQWTSAISDNKTLRSFVPMIMFNI